MLMHYFTSFQIADQTQKASTNIGLMNDDQRRVYDVIIKAATNPDMLEQTVFFIWWSRRRWQNICIQHISCHTTFWTEYDHSCCHLCYCSWDGFFFFFFACQVFYNGKNCIFGINDVYTVMRFINLKVPLTTRFRVLKKTILF